MQRMPEPGSFQEIEQPFHDAERCAFPLNVRSAFRTCALKTSRSWGRYRRIGWRGRWSLDCRCRPRAEMFFTSCAFQVVEALHVRFRFLAARRFDTDAFRSRQTFVN